MFDRLSRSWQLVRHSWNILIQDKELLWFPVFSAIASLFTLASFLTPVIYAVAKHGHELEAGEHYQVQPYWYAVMFVFYVLTFFITYYFNVAVMHCAAMRMDGGDPTLADGFRGANKHAVKLLGWAAISATVGIILRTIEQRLGLLGRIVIALVGCAWTVVTYFAVPVLVFEQVGAGDAVRRSAELMKKSWGEAMVASVGTNVVFSYLSLLGMFPFGAGIYLAAHEAPLAASFGVASLGIFYWLFLAVVSSAIKSVFQVALYRYAATGVVPGGYSQELLAGTFAPKRRMFGR